MGTVVQSISGLSWRNNRQIVASQGLVSQSAQEKAQSRIRASAGSTQNWCCTVENEEFSGLMSRRAAMASGVALVSSAVVGFPGDGLALVKQGLLAGRIPGLSEPDEQDRLENIPKTRREVGRSRCWVESHHSIFVFCASGLGRGSCVNC